MQLKGRESEDSDLSKRGLYEAYKLEDTSDTVRRDREEHENLTDSDRLAHTSKKAGNNYINNSIELKSCIAIADFTLRQYISS